MKRTSPYRAYEVVDTNSNKVVGTINWTGTKVSAEPKALQKRLEDTLVFGFSIQDGQKFLTALPTKFNNGYVTLREPKDKK